VSNPAKAKGTRWESALRDYFRAHGIPAYRPAQEGRLDVGDLHGLDPFVGQAKDYADTTTALRVGTDGATAQAENAGRDYGVAFVKRARAAVWRGYAVMTVQTFVYLLKRLQRAETALAKADPAAYHCHLSDVAGEVASAREERNHR
jgi:hypothetical protein